MKLKFLSLSLAGFISLPVFAASTLTGAGSTFVYPVLSLWANDYSKATGQNINYQSIGSGGGIAQMKAGTVDFAATDAPLSQADLDSAKLNQFPLVRGAIVMSENIKTDRPVTLDGNVIANIYLGQIKYWDDAAIQALNPGLKLPHQAINVLYRADGSGTTYNFTKYISGVSPAFKSKVGIDTVVSWPTGIGAKGNAGVANFIKTIPGSIGYVEYAYAVQNNLPIANFAGKNNKSIQPTLANFENGSYPLMATTYVLMPKSGSNDAALEKFFEYCFAHPESAKSLDYIPINRK